MPATARAVRERLPGSLPATRAAQLVDGDPEAFALTGAWAGVAAIVGSGPLVRLGSDDDPFAALGRLPALQEGGDAACAVGGGWFGALGYVLAGRVEHTVPEPPGRSAVPVAPLAFYDHVLVCDVRGAWWFEALATAARAAELEGRRDALAARLQAVPAVRPVHLRDVAWRPPGAAGHRRAVAAARERIAAGEIFQANVCLRFDARLDGRPADLAVAAAEALAPEYGGLLAGGGGVLVSASPELFLRRREREVLTRPIKGTAPVTGAPEVLAASAKDRAEHVMIVDLMRNDLGRVCAYGSVRVEALATPRTGAGVRHLVSDVVGDLRPGVGDAELLRATFPPGSVTGAPKVQALRVIAELEGAAREAYTGALGYASPVAGLELSVVIRTFELRGDAVQLGVGGGITSGSDPEAELEECHLKAAPLLALGGATVPPEPSAPPVPAFGGATVPPEPGDSPVGGVRGAARRRQERPLPLALADGRERPDPAVGLRETLLVRDGVARRLEEHLLRLRASALALGGVAPPEDLADRLRAAAAPAGAARLRVDLLPGGTATVATGPLPAGEGPVILRPVLLPGGLGPHKWADRRLLDALAEALGAVPLLVDGDGAVLEAAWATVWVQEGDRLVTPRADGRLLPGIARTALLARGGRHAEGDVPLARLAAADALWVSTALRGLVPARLDPRWSAGV